MLTKLQIIDETEIAYSDPSNRANIKEKDGIESCSYLNQGKICALGRCMIDPGEVDRKYGSDEVMVLIDALEEDSVTLDDLLKEKYRGHDLKFWADLQDFHDRGEHFHITGISAAGKQYLSNLREFWGKNEENH